MTRRYRGWGRRRRTADREAEPEQVLISRAWRRTAVRTAAVFVVALVLVDAVAAGLVLRADRIDTGATVARVMAHPTIEPPVGVWVYRWPAGTAGDPGTAPATGTGAPPAPLDPVALRAVAAGAPGRSRELERGDREYLLRTDRVPGGTAQVVLDLTYRERARHQTYLSLLAAGALGIALSVLVGTLTARRSIRPLGEALARQRRFVADASHELRTPLTQLHTRAQLLDRAAAEQVPGSALARDAGAMVAGTRQLGDLVDDLLLAASQRADPAQAGPVDLAAVAGQAVDAEAHRAAKRRVRLVVHADAAGGYLVRGAPAALRRVLTALVDNALGHVAPGGSVTVELSRRDHGVACLVHDDGVGFDGADAERIFQRFARGGHGDGRRFGLGLALVRQVVADHGGTVSATGRPGQGATFAVWLPAWGGPAPAGPVVSRSGHPPGTRPTGRRSG